MFLNRPIFVHATASCFALLFAYVVWQSAFAKTGVQFVAPMLIVIAVHVATQAWTKQLAPGFAGVIFRKCAFTGLWMATGLFMMSMLAPSPAVAASDGMETALMVIFCVFVIAVILAIIGFGLWVIYRLIKAIVVGINANRSNDPDSRLFDISVLVAAVGMLGLGSVEGISDRFSFARAGFSTTSQVIDAPTDVVWATMETATSPEIPLPAILTSFPQPVAVSIDEGTRLGANRIVNFAGREGAGSLSLRVVERTENAAVFDILSDTTPYAGWIGYQRLTYEVTPMGEQSRLDVSLHYERKLSPAWFFGPAMNKAGQLAMKVLAGDVQTRAEAAVRE